jgi:hypothetical protein
MCGAVSIKTDQKAFPPRENSQKNIKIYIKKLLKSPFIKFTSLT